MPTGTSKFSASTDGKGLAVEPPPAQLTFTGPAITVPDEFLNSMVPEPAAAAVENTFTLTSLTACVALNCIPRGEAPREVAVAGAVLPAVNSVFPNKDDA